MSADNRVCYLKHPHFDEWCVWHGSGSMDYYEPPALYDSYPTEEEARAAAHAMADEISYLEYGVGPICIEEQEQGLVWAIEDLTARLKRLRETGSQERCD